MTDYEQISIIVEQIQGLLSRADNMSKNGVYKDFIRIIEKVREINDNNGLGQHGTLLSLINSEISNWSELMDKCIILLPIVEGFERRLRPGGDGGT
ncbi:hypothetical protein CEE34_07725 [Candidatus Aerophobetes bacterium Ae_b3a]|nr:MAG: hypothetical protein CEE34_07725 [Candidatus Aerophobetes bacterium Ae_b3a]